MKSLCVFCGSSPGQDPAYANLAAQLGRTLAQRNIGVVYGGGRAGLMGVLADAALAAGGEVIGVIPQALMVKELAHAGLSELHVVASMHERKALMAERADGMIALPGGFGTLEEWFEVLTWSQLGFHAKPCGLLNVAGYYDPLLAFLDHTVDERFVQRAHRDMIIASTSSVDLLRMMAEFHAPVFEKWIDRAAL